MRELLICLLLLLPFKNVFAQADTVQQLTLVEVKADRLKNFAVGGNLQEFSKDQLTAYHHQNLDKLLTEQSGLYIRSYGAGSLATASGRGGGFGHTAVIWNGFNLQSSMNGGTDLLLFPILGFQEVQLQYGGSSSLSGNGAIGASIHLNQNLPLNQGFQLLLGAAAGSFDDYRQNGRLMWSGKRISSQLSVYHQSADNDYKYKNGNQSRHLEHARSRRTGIMYNQKLLLGKRQSLNFYSWYQYNDRQIPPTLTAASDEAQQKDKSLRLAAEWVAIKPQLVLKTRAAYLREDIFFQSNVVVASPTLTQSLDVQGEVDIVPGAGQRLNGGVQLIQEFARAEAAFVHPRSRQRLAAFGAWTISLSAAELGLSIRQELVDGAPAPLTLSAGLEGPLSEFWSWRLSSARNYHLPTFNDLYWEGAGGKGNPALESEKGWSVEAGLVQQKRISNFHFVQHFNLFSNSVRNWILWSPLRPDFWQPDNVLEVWSRGAEYRMHFAFQFIDWKVNARLQYSFTKTTNQSPYEAGNASTNHLQLPLTPQHLAMLSIGGEFRKYQIDYLHRLNGSQFTDRLHTGTLTAFQLGQLRLGRRWNFSSHKMTLAVIVENLWNADYQTLPFRPMPGRSFRLEVKYGFSGWNG